MSDFQKLTGTAEYTLLKDIGLGGVAVPPNRLLDTFYKILILKVNGAKAHDKRLLARQNTYVNVVFKKMCLPLYINTEVGSFDNLLYRKIIGEYGHGSEVGQMIMAKHNLEKKKGSRNG